MKAKKVIGLLVALGVLFSSISMMTVSATGESSVPGVSVQDFEEELTAARYDGAGTFPLVERVEGNKWLQITESKSYAFNVKYANAAGIGKDWNSYAFYLKTTGAVSITPHLDHWYSINLDSGSDRLYVPSGEVTLIDSTGSKSVLSVEAGGVLNFTEAYEGWVMISKSNLVDAWGGTNSINDVPAGSIGSIMFGVSNMGTDVVVNIDDVTWLAEKVLIQNFEEELTAARYDGAGTFPLVERVEGNKWLQITESKSYAFNVKYANAAGIGKNWSSYVFYLKTTGAVSITPHLDHWYSINLDSGSDRLYVPSGEVTLIDSTGSKSVLSVEAGGVLNFTEAYEGWVMISKSNLVDAWGGTNSINDVPAGSIGSIMFGVGNMGTDVVVNIDDIAWTFDENAFDNVSVPITIAAQPEDIVKESGETATFSVTATADEEIAYQWQISTNKGQSWSNIEGATAATYTTGALTAENHQTQYRCSMFVKSSNMPVITLAATLYVDKYPDVVIDYEIGSNPISADVFEDAKGKNVNIIINVKDGGETVYTWTINGKDITNAVAFNPEIEVKDVADIALDEIAPDALYFETKQTGKLPGKASLKLDTSFNFFEGEDLWLYSVDTEGKLTFVADGMVSGVSTSEVTLTAAGSYVLNNVKIAGAAVPTEPGNTDSSNSASDVTDTGLNDIVVLLAVALFGIALTTVVISKKSVKTK